MVKFRPEIEPVVRLIEDTPRDSALEVAIAQLKKGLSYKNLLAGLFLAGIRNIKPRPVGFKFHAVMVINSAHVLGQSSAVTERLLPLLWALDNFKGSQAQDVKEGDWVLGPVDECRLPKPHQAKAELVDGRWRSGTPRRPTRPSPRSAAAAGAAETMEPLWRMACATSAISATRRSSPPRAGEPCRRSAGSTPSRSFARSSSACSTSRATAGRGLSGPTRPTWKTPPRFARTGRSAATDPAATAALLQVIRQATPEAASAEAVKLLNQGIAPGSLWDAAILSACELLMHSPGIVAIHATTATNALHYIYTASGDDTTRRLALLQAVGWQPMYRGRVKLTDSAGIDSLKASPDVQISSGDEAVGEIFATINEDRKKAGAKAMAYLARGGSPDLIFDAARRMIFHKGRDSHDYKYGAAVWEECLWSTEPKWRNPMVAASMFNFPGAKTADSPLMIRAREALATVMG